MASGIHEEEDLDSLDLKGAMGGNVDGLKAIADTTQEQEEIDVDQSGKPIGNAKSTDENAPIVISRRGSVGDDDEPVIEQKEKKEEIVLEKAGSETSPELEKTVEKTVENTVEEPTLEKKRDRVYLNELPQRRRLEFKLAAQNPDMPLEDVAKQVDKILAEAGEAGEDADIVSYEEMSIEDQLEQDRAELEQVSATVLEKDKAFIRDNEWEAAAKRQQELNRIIPKKELLVEREQESQSKVIASREESTEKATVDFPELLDPETELYQAVAGRVAGIVATVKAGKAPPAGLDPRDPNFPLLVAQEQVAKIKGKQPTVAKPVGSDAVAPFTRRVISPVPGSAGTQTARQAADDAGDGSQESLQSLSSRVQNDGDLDEVIALALKSPVGSRTASRGTPVLR